MFFDVNYMDRAKKTGSQKASDEPLTKRARTQMSSTHFGAPRKDAPVPLRRSVQLSSLSPEATASGSGSRIGASSYQSLFSSSEAAWQKLFASFTKTELADVVNVKSFNLAYDINHDIFRERKRREETLTELEITKDVTKVTEAENEKVMHHEWDILEENKAFRSEYASLWKELQTEKKLREIAKQKVIEINEEFENAVENFKKTDDFQALLMPVFL